MGLMPYSDPERQKKYAREWLARRRSTWLKENGPCVNCGSWKGLEVDHVDPKKKVDHRVWSWSVERRNKELSKCQVLCARCHKKKTSDARIAKIGHGSRYMYDRVGCRCEKCRAEKSRHNALRRVRRKCGSASIHDD
jgi:hypothetical protein